MTRPYAYRVVDVFTDVPFAGNMLAVFPDAAGLTTGEMQAIACELNLSETTFVFAPEGPTALARVRIFTPEVELPFAGHPVVGTAFVLAFLEGRSTLQTFEFETNVGRIAVRLESREDRFFAWLRTPPIAFGETLDRARCAATLGLLERDLLEAYPTRILSAGNPFLYVALRDAATVDRASLDARALDDFVPKGRLTGVFIFAPSGEPRAFYSRMFVPHSSVPEDPATGSATGPLGAYLFAYGLIARHDGVTFLSEQGVRMRRRSLVHGRLHVGIDGTLRDVDVGGSAVHVADATMYVPGGDRTDAATAESSNDRTFPS